MKRLEDQLTSLSKPTVDLPLHRAQLRRVLLNSSSKRFGSFTSFTMTFSKLLPASLALVLVFGLAFTFRSQTPDYVRYVAPTASAEELVNSTVEHLKSLTADELEQLAADRGFTVDGIFKDLSDAALASDLALAPLNSVSCEELSSQSESIDSIGVVGSDVQFSVNEDGTQSPQAGAPCAAVLIHLDADQNSSTGYDFGVSFQGAEEISNAQGLTGVQYTDAKGERVLLLLTEDPIPYSGVHFSPNEMTMTFGYGE